MLQYLNVCLYCIYCVNVAIFKCIFVVLMLQYLFVYLVLHILSLSCNVRLYCIVFLVLTSLPPYNHVSCLVLTVIHHNYITWIKINELMFVFLLFPFYNCLTTVRAVYIMFILGFLVLYTSIGNIYSKYF